MPSTPSSTDPRSRDDESLYLLHPSSPPPDADRAAVAALAADAAEVAGAIAAATKPPDPEQGAVGPPPAAPAQEPASSLGHVPDGAWAFDAEVTRVFDDMLRRSIPDHDEMRRLVLGLARRHAQRDTFVVDLGCSRGEAIAALVDALGAANRFLACDVSEPMLEAARARFRGMIAAGVVDVRKLDLRTDYPPVAASVTLAVLSLQFTPIEHRQRILRRCYRHTLPGGCLILVEKVLGATADLDAALVDGYYAFKRASGYSQDEIDRKRLALEGVLVPVTAAWNEELLRQAGFSQVDCFWRHLNFAGWIAVRDAAS